MVFAQRKGGWALVSQAENTVDRGLGRLLLRRKNREGGWIPLRLCYAAVCHITMCRLAPVGTPSAAEAVPPEMWDGDPSQWRPVARVKVTGTGNGLK